MLNTYILGPCAIESTEMFIETLDVLRIYLDGYDWYFKGSFDKANRTSIEGKRGVGLDAGIEIFKLIKTEYPDIKLLTDVHECWQVEKLADCIDCIQIPAFLSRQTDLIIECAKHFNKVNIKKGQWIGPNNLKISVDKIKNTNPNCEAWITDRGSNFGYDKVLPDFTIVEELKKHYDKVILDCTHSTQHSKAVYGDQGDRKLAERYFSAAPLLGYDGVFVEIHPAPLSAISDGDCQLDLMKFNKVWNIHNSVKGCLL